MVTIGVAQRVDIIVEATGSPTDAVYMRSNVGPGLGSPFGCSLNDDVSPLALAAIYYEKADRSKLPTSTTTADIQNLLPCAGEDLNVTVPYYSIIPNEPDVTIDLLLEFKSNGTDLVWFVNNSTFRTDYNAPILLQARAGNFSFPPERNVYDFRAYKTVRLVVYHSYTFGNHDMHLHGHYFHVLASGQGTWDGTITKTAFVVLQYDLNNPGTWPFHCHVALHLSSGLYINTIELPGELERTRFPASVYQTCVDWDKWTNRNVPDQIDSGD